MGIENYFTIQIISSLIFPRYPDSGKMHMAEVNSGDAAFPVVWLTATAKEKSDFRHDITDSVPKMFSGECFALCQVLWKLC